MIVPVADRTGPGHPTRTVTRSFTGGLRGAWSLPTTCTAKECLPGGTSVHVYVVPEMER
jgi:hypothetical protein